MRSDSRLYASAIDIVSGGMVAIAVLMLASGLIMLRGREM